MASASSSAATTGFAKGFLLSSGTEPRRNRQQQQGGMKRKPKMEVEVEVEETPATIIPAGRSSKSPPSGIKAGFLLGQSVSPKSTRKTDLKRIPKQPSSPTPRKNKGGMFAKGFLNSKPNSTKKTKTKKTSKNGLGGDDSNTATTMGSDVLPQQHVSSVASSSSLSPTTARIEEMSVTTTTRSLTPQPDLLFLEDEDEDEDSRLVGGPAAAPPSMVSRLLLLQESEGASRSSPTQSMMRRPLISVLGEEAEEEEEEDGENHHHNSDNDTYHQDGQQRVHRPLISMIDDDHVDSRTPHDGWVTEVATRPRRRALPQHRLLPGDDVDVDVVDDNYHDDDDSSFTLGGGGNCRVDGILPSTASLPTPEATTTTTTTVTSNKELPISNDRSFLDFQQELASMTWKTPRRHNQDSTSKRGMSESTSDAKRLLINVEKEWTTTKVGWAWEWLFRIAATTTPIGMTSSSSSTILHPLAESLLTHHPVSTLPWLQKVETLDDRTRALQMVQWMRSYIFSLSREALLVDIAMIEAWSTNALPALVALVEQSTRRTVLAQEAWATALPVLRLVAEAAVLASHSPDSEGSCDDHSTPTLHQSFPEARLVCLMDHLDLLLHSQLQWKHSTKKKSSPKRKCQICLLEDLIESNRKCRKARLVTEWQRQVLGVSSLALPNHRPLLGNWGGLCHLFDASPTAHASSNAEDVLAMAQQITTVCTGVSCSRDAAADDDNDSDWIEQHMMFRGLLAEICTLKSSVFNDQVKLQQLGELLIPSIAVCRTEATTPMLLASLEYIWSKTDGLPPDILSCPAESATSLQRIPRSMELLLDALPTELTQRSLTSSSSFSILARWIRSHPDSRNLLEAIMTRDGLEKTTSTVVLVSLAKGFEAGFKNTLSDSSNTEDLALRDCVENKLVEGISKSSFMRQEIQSSDGSILAKMNTKRHVPKLIRLLCEHCDGDRQKSSKEIEESITLILTASLKEKLSTGKTHVFVNEIIHALKEETKSVSGNSKELCGTICSTFGAKWRSLLIKSVDVSDTAFAGAVVAIGAAMIASPSNVVPLALFGALIGDESQAGDLLSNLCRRRILKTIEETVRLCTDQMENSVVENGDVFSRLAPLLLLRRIPIFYFRISRSQAETTDCYQLHDLSVVLAERVVVLLEKNSSTQPGSIVTPEERRLAAEVAGRCLPFGEEPNRSKQISPNFRSCSTFAHICMPYFSKLVASFSAGWRDATTITSLRKARVALYAACHYIQYASGVERFDHECYRTAAFAMYIIGIDFEGMPTDFCRELLQLQTGCIEFFGICLGQGIVEMEERKAISQQQISYSTGVTAFPLARPSETPVNDRSTVLAGTTAAVVSILQEKELTTEDDWILSAESYFLHPSQTSERTEVSLQAKTCLWNSFILVAQRCQDDKQLPIVAKATLPWIAEWSIKFGQIGNETENASWCAAAMQVVFTILARSKSFASFDGGYRSKKDYIRTLHGWGLRTTIRWKQVVSTNGTRALRLAALKLILSVLVLDSINAEPSPGGYGSSIDSSLLVETFTMITDLSNFDKDLEVKSLSTHILHTLRKRS